VERSDGFVDLDHSQLTYVVLALGPSAGLRMDRAASPLVGAHLMLVTGD